MTNLIEVLFGLDAQTLFSHGKMLEHYFLQLETGVRYLDRSKLHKGYPIISKNDNIILCLDIASRRILAFDKQGKMQIIDAGLLNETEKQGLISTANELNSLGAKHLVQTPKGRHDTETGGVVQKFFGKFLQRNAQNTFEPTEPVREADHIAGLRKHRPTMTSEHDSQGNVDLTELNFAEER